MQLKLVKSFIGPSIYSAHPGLVLSVALPATLPFNFASLGNDFGTDLSNLLERIRLRAEQREGILGARNLGELLIALVLHLQRHSGALFERGKILGHEPPGQRLLFYEYGTANVGWRASCLASTLIQELLSRSGHAAADENFDAGLELK